MSFIVDKQFMIIRESWLGDIRIISDLLSFILLKRKSFCDNIITLVMKLSIFSNL